MKTQAFMKSFKFASASRLGEVNLRKIDKISKSLQNENISAAHGQLMYSELQEELFAMVKTALSPPRKKIDQIFRTFFFEWSFYHSNPKIYQKKCLAKFETISV